MQSRCTTLSLCVEVCSQRLCPSRLTPSRTHCCVSLSRATDSALSASCPVYSLRFVLVCVVTGQYDVRGVCSGHSLWHLLVSQPVEPDHGRLVLRCRHAAVGTCKDLNVHCADLNVHCADCVTMPANIIMRGGMSVLKPAHRVHGCVVQARMIPSCTCLRVVVCAQAS
jgi:hypothetical protein